jgi:hypothetical protein
MIAAGPGKRFGDNRALEGFDLAIAEGSVCGPAVPPPAWPIAIGAVLLRLAVHRDRIMSR